MTDTLWFKFPDETAAVSVFDDVLKQKFDAVFSVENKASPWNRALEFLDLPCHPERSEGSPLLNNKREILRFAQDDKLVYWFDNTPYFNWSVMTSVVSGGAIKVLRKNDGGYAFHVSYAPRDLWRLFVCQWKTVKFLQKKIGPEDALAESIALGLVLQSMMLRLGRDAELNLAKWLSGAAEIPPRFKKTVMQMQAIQMRRTALSPTWKNLLPQGAEQSKNLPEYFWSSDSVIPAKAGISSQQDSRFRGNDGSWKGLSVCAGRVTGRVVVIKSVKDAVVEKGDMPLILVFKRARPESVELYPQASAVVFAEGGILAHACVVAREMNLPSVTGLGEDFFDAIKSGMILSVDGGEGTVNKLSS